MRDLVPQRREWHNVKRPGRAPLSESAAAGHVHSLSTAVLPSELRESGVFQPATLHLFELRAKRDFGLNPFPIRVVLRDWEPAKHDAHEELAPLQVIKLHPTIA